MSASSTPTLRPIALSASARLAATVDLPTPPLPEATAMIAPTPGTAPRRDACAAPAPGPGACRRMAVRVGMPVRRRPLRLAARLRLGGQHRGHRQHARQRLDRLLGRLAQRLEARPALGLDLDGKADIAVADDDPRDHAERDDVGALVGVAHLPQRVEDLSLGDGGHRVLLLAGRNWACKRVGDT